MNGKDGYRLDLSLRKVLGFDVRASLSKLIDDMQHGPVSSGLNESLCRLTIDGELWPSLVQRDEEHDEPQLNGYNLFSELSVNVLAKIAQEEQALRAAFDIAASAYASLQGTFGAGWNRSGATSKDLLEQRWVLLGFDVVDPRTQLSGLHSFDFSPVERAQVEVTARPAANVFGLLGTLCSAEASAFVLNNIVPDHAPFFACGVWVATV